MTKQICTIVMAGMLLLGVACSGGGGGNGSSAPALKDGVTLAGVLQEIEDEYGVTMPSPVDDQLLEELMGVKLSDVEEYAGSISLVNVSADHIVGVKAQPGKIDEVQTALEARLDAVRKEFERYLPEQYDKAMAGKVITIGDYAFLVITGRLNEDPVSEMAAIESKIQSKFVNT